MFTQKIWRKFPPKNPFPPTKLMLAINKQKCKWQTPPPPPCAPTKWWSLQAAEVGQAMEEEEGYLPDFPVVMCDSLAVLLCIALPLRLQPIHKLQPGPRRAEGQEAPVESWCQQALHCILQFTHAKETKPPSWAMYLCMYFYTNCRSLPSGIIHPYWTLSTVRSSVYAPLCSAGEDSMFHREGWQGECCF